MEMGARIKCQQGHDALGLWATCRCVWANDHFMFNHTCTAEAATCTSNAALVGSGEVMDTDRREFLSQQKQTYNHKNTNNNSTTTYNSNHSISLICGNFYKIPGVNSDLQYIVTTITAYPSAICPSVWKHLQSCGMNLHFLLFLTFTKYISRILFSIPRQQNPFS